MSEREQLSRNLLLEAADFLYMAWGYVPAETREKCKYLERALRDAPLSEIRATAGGPPPGASSEPDPELTAAAQRSDKNERDYVALLNEFETLVLDANDPQLPRRGSLPVQKRLNEVRAQLQSFARSAERCKAKVVVVPGIGEMKWCDPCGLYFGTDQPCPSARSTQSATAFAVDSRTGA